MTVIATPRPRRHRRLFAHELRALLVIAGPIIVAQLGSVGMNTADTIMVGALGATALAAVGVGSAIHILSVMICTGTIIGVTPLVAQAWGAGRRDECGRTLIQGLWLALILSVPVVLVALAGGPIAAALGQKPEVVAVVDDYMDALAWGAPAFLVFTAFRQWLEGMGITAPTALITFFALGANIGANAAFMYGWGPIPGMGAVGAGHATSLVRWFMLAAMAGWLLGHRELNPFRGVPLALDPRRLRRVVTVGVPVGVQIGLEVALFAFAAVMMGWFGPAQLAAHQIAINIASTTFMVALGVSLAGTVRVGHHIGAARERAVHRAVVGTYLLAVGFMALCAIAFVTFPSELIGLYTDDAAIISVAKPLLVMAAVFQVFDGAQVAGMGILRGAADTRAPAIIAAVGYWALGMPIALYLGFRTTLGPVGVWIGLSLALAVVALLLAHRVRTHMWRPHTPA